MLHVEVCADEPAESFKGETSLLDYIAFVELDERKATAWAVGKDSR